MKTLRDMTEPEMKEYFQMLAEATESVLPAGPSASGRCLFVLLVFDDPGLAQYVSNASLENMIRALRETADRFERDEVIPI
jgi:hypothetical protein